MRLKRPFLVALALSLALHLVVITGPAWELPTLDQLLEPDEGPTLDAHLVAHPGPVAVRPVRPKPRPPRPAAPVEPEASPGGAPRAAEPATPEPVAERAEAPPADAGAAAVPVTTMSLPGYVRIEYQVTMGEGAFPIGRAIQEIRHEGGQYSMRNDANTTGIVSLFRPARIVNVSAGDVVAGGLRPREYWVRRDNGKGEAGHLDWDAGQVRLDNGRSYPLEAGTQDLLSMFAQLTLLAIEGNVVSLPVATGKKVERYEFAVLGAETIATPRGDRATLHLRNRQPNGREATEVWLGLDDGRLPIKIRHIDRRGDIFDQIAVRIEFEEMKEGTR
jgi:hypothetical protein